MPRGEKFMELEVKDEAEDSIPFEDSEPDVVEDSEVEVEPEPVPAEEGDSGNVSNAGPVYVRLPNGQLVPSA